MQPKARRGGARTASGDAPPRHAPWGTDALALQVRTSCRLPPTRHQHGDALAIVLVLVAKKFDQITFLQCDADKNVGCRDEGEEQMACGHNRRRPEGDDEAEIDRMSHELIEHWRLEARLGS